MGVRRSTLSNWKNKYPLIIGALGKEVSDREVENALFKRAKRQVPSDSTAIIFWLKNRKPQAWRDRREIDHSGEMKQTVVERKDLSKLSVEELKQIESILKKSTDG